MTSSMLSCRPHDKDAAEDDAATHVPKTFATRPGRHITEDDGFRADQGVNPVNEEIFIERLFHSLVSGDRAASRQLAREALDSHVAPEEMALRIYWPVMENITKLFRADQLSMLAHHYATRTLRQLLDQTQARYEQRPRRNRTICLFSGPSETEELAGQLVTDLAEADGYSVFFGGGGIAADEILAEVAERGADVLLLFASAPSDAPGIRQLIDTVREVNALPDLQVVVGGGVFARAPGLAEEIGADLWAHDPEELLELLVTEKERRAPDEQRTVGRNRRVSRAA